MCINNYFFAIVGVGKSSLLLRFADNLFSGQYSEGMIVDIVKMILLRCYTNLLLLD